MKKLLILSCAVGALALAGCAQVDSFIQAQIIDPAAAMFTNPNTKLVASIVAADTIAFACIIDAGTTVAGAIESNPAFKAGASVQGTNLKINVASTAACTSLQGILQGQVTVSAGGTVVSQ